MPNADVMAEEQEHAAGPRREPERWRVRSREPGSDMDTWGEILADTHVAFDVRTSQRAPDRFHGTVTRQRFGDLALVDCASSEFVGSRSRSMVNEHPQSVLGFHTLRRGVEKVRAGRMEFTMTAGDVIVWDSSQAVDVEVIEPFVKRTMIAPLEHALAICPRLEGVGGIPHLKQTGATRLLVRYLDALAMELPHLDTAEAAAASDVALELLRAAVEPNVPTSRSAKRAALRAEIHRYVKTHLQDPALGPDSIAWAHALSVRALHALFEGSGESVAGLVRHQRLARCFEDLQQPSAGSVTEIAFRWGFRDAAHFSRVFKREFQSTPSEVRHAAEAGAQIDKESGVRELARSLRGL
jgi:AraC family transcriptional activator of tynA and feaB